MRPSFDLRVYAVLDPARCHGRDPVRMAVAAARGGATLLQLRDKNATTRRQAALTRAIVAALAPYGVPLIVNDRADVAHVAGAAGVHLGQDDLAPEDARTLLGPDALIGVTVHHPAEADRLPPGVADYAGIGPIHATTSKDSADPPIGPAGARRLIAHLHHHLPGLPCCGIAGIDHANAAEVIAAGVDGVAVISDIFMADDVEAAARRLRAVVDRALQERRSI